MLGNWIRLAIRFRAPILAAWLIAIVLGVAASVGINDRLTTSLGVPGSESAQAEKLLATHFNENSEGTFTVFYKFKNATKPEIEGFKNSISRAVSLIPSAKVLQSRALGGTLFASIGTAYDLPHAAAFTEPLRQSLRNEGLIGALVTGPPAIKSDVSPILARDLHRGEAVAVALGLVLLILVLGFSLAALIPLIFAGATILTTLGLVYLLSPHIPMVLYIPNIIELIGLGLAIDYSLLIVQRFRRECERGDIDNAIKATMFSAGRTILFSGTTVALGLATLILVPVPFIRSLGTAGVLVPLVAILATLTLQPALLSYLAAEGVHTYGFHGFLDRSQSDSSLIARVTDLVIRRPLIVFISSLTVVLLALTPLLGLHLTPSSLTAIPSNLESAKAISLVTGSAGSGAITPTELVIDLGSPNRAAEVSAARTALATAISSESEVFLVANGEKAPYVDASGRFLRMYIVGKHDLGADQTHQLLKTLREKYLANNDFPAGTKFYLGGAPAQGSDLLHKLLSAMPWIVLLILLLTYVLLYRAFRSVVLPLKAILLDLISIGLSLSVVVSVVHFGVGSSMLGTYHLRDIEAWVLLFLFAVLFGLSMDYEVFIVSRMREAWDRGESNEDSIREGMVLTGGVVTAAAAILIIAVSGLAFGHFAGLQQLGLGLAGGILIDATLIRGLLLPSAMVLLGKWNWWRP